MLSSAMAVIKRRFSGFPIPEVELAFAKVQAWSPFRLALRPDGYDGLESLPSRNLDLPDLVEYHGGPDCPVYPYFQVEG
jgi:hypothetical protein